MAVLIDTSILIAYERGEVDRAARVAGREAEEAFLNGQRKNGALRIGGVGQVTYTALDDDRYALAALNMLADFALYSGVGVQTATGMGQCRRVGCTFRRNPAALGSGALEGAPLGRRK